MPVDRDVSRCSFLRRALGAGVGLLSLEFIGASLAFTWPNITEGLGARIRIGTLQDILVAEPRFAQGQPFAATRANSFLVNAPAARALASGDEVSLPSPAAGDLIALWRRCPHLGCRVPKLCEERSRFECLCHGSTYNILGEKLEKGPAARGMDRFAVEMDPDGWVVIDTRQVIRGAPEGTVTFHDPHPANEGCAA
jgi:Rieske Fe-S protein